jgi:protocatechuate 3,4-dioxygenase beta subunit
MTGASQLQLDRRRMLGGLALGLGGAALTACGSRAGAQAGYLSCPPTPPETRGPFPADGSNGQPPINALTSEGIVRRDIRSSFAELHGRAEGVPLELELTLATHASCVGLPGRAVYLWHNDAVGLYSLYDRTDVNYLRGLQPADEGGRVRFTTIVPGCYGGRYPHCHFEVFESVDAAIGGARPLLISQLAFPEEECGEIYREDPRYGESLRNLERQPIERDFVFQDVDRRSQTSQIVRLHGDPSRGYRGTAWIGLSG